MSDPLKSFYAVIMAGGGGTRLWPLSRQSRPKQVLDLVGGRSMFNIAVDRLEGLFPHDHIYVVTVQEQAEQLMQLCPTIPGDNYLIEPFPRGTASVVGLAATVLQDKDPEAVMAVLTADHFIENITLFQRLLGSAYRLSMENYLVTLGIQPTFPSTGYGYIQRGEAIGEYGGFKVYRALKFKEKPALADAERFLESRDHDWNSGMFIWKTENILAEIDRQMPELAGILTSIRDMLKDANWNQNIGELWGKITPQSIDYGIMEHAQQMAVIPAANLGWNDVGAWDSLYDVLQPDQYGNIVRHDDFIGLESKNVVVLSRESRRLIVTIGVENLIVVDTGDALLVCSRDKAQNVKDVVNRLKSDGRQEYL